MGIELPGPRDEAYWDEDALLAEEKRVFEICNGCRLCWNLCPSFPELFNAVDALDNDDPEDTLGQAEALEVLPVTVNDRVVDLCYQCKLCDPICPYTPPHEFAVDFPRLMLRHKAIRAKQNGVKTQDFVLGDPNLIGFFGTRFPEAGNWANHSQAQRQLMETVVGIHRDRKLPNFASETFLDWWARRGREQPEPSAVEGRKVVLFHTCSVNFNEPQVGRAAIEVLEHNGITVFVADFACCGMPALDGGDVERATSWMSQNVRTLMPFVEAGCDIVTPGPTCTYMIKHEWKEYLGTEASEKVGAACFDLMEYIWNLRKQKELREDYEATEMGDIAYHVPCHLKVQKIGFRSRDVMKKLPGAKVKLLDKCSCMDGTWGMKTEFYELSKQWAKPLLEGFTDAPEARYVSDCLIAKLQIEENTGKPVQHPIEVLREAYGGKIR